ncbi:hypothetical protein LZ30DRAFT_8433 [Colletotrichum cereale]|nr:hypothetical protein LZ30DRAFT_8433 [Colletotrichum cereale]
MARINPFFNSNSCGAPSLEQSLEMHTTQTPTLPSNSLSTFAKHAILGSPRLESTYTAHLSGALKSLFSSLLASPIDRPFSGRGSPSSSASSCHNSRPFPMADRPYIPMDHRPPLSLPTSLFYLSLQTPGFKTYKPDPLPKETQFFRGRTRRVMDGPLAQSQRLTAARLPAYSFPPSRPSTAPSDPVPLAPPLSCLFITKRNHVPAQSRTHRDSVTRLP